MPFQIRHPTPEEYKIVQAWGSSEQWNLGIHDYEAFLAIDPETFWIGLLDGQPVSFVGIAQYDENFSFVGIYITKPQFRGNGYGFQTWKKAFERITAKNTALEGVIAQEPNYVKSGFKTYHTTLRMSLYGKNEAHNSLNLVDCRTLKMQDLSNFDRENFPSRREKFLERWINILGAKATAYVKDGKIQGYGVLRPSDQGYRVGPLFANSYQIASQILRNLAGSLNSDTRIDIDIPEINKNAIQLANQWKMQKIFEFKRMYTNGLPETPMDKNVYGVTSIQFG